ncbi:MAG: hypothetical protein LBP51_06350 [Deferribacteraceae bacterium]|nr:hypothetical protein [Deferribacteraceae bacterium]
MRCVLLLFIFLFVVSCQLFQKNNSSSESPPAAAVEPQAEEAVIINEPPPSTVSGFGCVKKTDYGAEASMFGQAQTYFSGVLFSYLNIYECEEGLQERAESIAERSARDDYTSTQDFGVEE